MESALSGERSKDPRGKGRTYDKNAIEVLLEKQVSWERVFDFTAEACRNLWTKKETSKRGMV